VTAPLNSVDELVTFWQWNGG